MRGCVSSTSRIAVARLTVTRSRIPHARRTTDVAARATRLNMLDSIPNEVASARARGLCSAIKFRDAAIPRMPEVAIPRQFTPVAIPLAGARRLVITLCDGASRAMSPSSVSTVWFGAFEFSMRPDSFLGGGTTRKHDDMYAMSCVLQHDIIVSFLAYPAWARRVACWHGFNRSNLEPWRQAFGQRKEKHARRRDNDKERSQNAENISKL